MPDAQRGKRNGKFFTTERQRHRETTEPHDKCSIPGTHHSA